MKVRSEQTPPGAFTIEDSRPGFVKVRMFRNATYHDKPYWEYDVYQIEIPANMSIDDIMKEYDLLIDRAMAEE